MATYQFQGQDIVAPFRITSNEPALSTDSITLRVRRVTQGAQRWELDFGVVMEDASSYLADMVSTFNETVQMEMPQLNVRGETISSGTSTTAITTAGTGNVGNTTAVSVTGANGTIKKGRFVKFSDHDKVYLVIADFTGTGNISLYPSLRQNVVAGTTLLYRDGTDAITFTAFRDIDNQAGITFVDGILSDGGSITLIEAL